MKRIAEPVETTELCSYGCGQTARFKNGSGKLMCCERSNSCPAVKAKNSAGLKRGYENGRDQKQTYSNLPQETKDRMKWNKGNVSADFSYNGKGSHKKVLVQERGHRCERCQNTEWNGMEIPIQLEHIDGNNKNNVKENLLLLCPNCHAQTSTYCGKNIKTHVFVSDELLLDAILTTKNVRQALLKVGLTPKSGNYDRAYRIKGELVKLANTSGLSPDASA